MDIQLSNYRINETVEKEIFGYGFALSTYPWYLRYDGRLLHYTVVK